MGRDNKHRLLPFLRYSMVTISFLLLIFVITKRTNTLVEHTDFTRTKSNTLELVAFARDGDDFSNNQNYANKEEKLPNCPIKLLTRDEEFLDYFDNVHGECSNWTIFGGPPVGGIKFVCLDHKFNFQPGNCHVLSFGINDEWSFDDDMDDFNCKVYAFDPTMNREDHNRSQNIQFFNIGIGSIQGNQTVGMTEKGFHLQKVDRYENILRRLGLLETPIDYIKMDVEKAELDFFMDLFINSPQLLKNIKQIGMEVHHGYEGGDLGYKSLFQLFWAAFQFLDCYGFKLYHSRKAGPWHEVVWAREANW